MEKLSCDVRSLRADVAADRRARAAPAGRAAGGLRAAAAPRLGRADVPDRPHRPRGGATRRAGPAARRAGTGSRCRGRSSARRSGRLRARAPGAPTARSPRRTRSACTGRTPASRSRRVVGSTREPLQPIPGPNHQVKMSSRPREPEVVRRHRLRRVLVDQRGQRVEVVGLEGGDVAVEQLAVGHVRTTTRGSSSVCSRVARARCSALFTEATLVSSSSATSARLPAQHLAEDQRRALPRRQVLQRGDEGEPDRLARGDHLGRVGHQRVGDRLQPRHLGRAAGSRSPARRRGRDPSAARAAGCPRAGRGRRSSRSGRATSGAPSGPRSGRGSARPGAASPAPRPRPRTASRACGSSARSARGGAARAPRTRASAPRIPRPPS